jgi:hypothetical protein
MCLMNGATWFSIVTLLGIPLALLDCSSGSGSSNAPAICGQLTDYTASVTTPLSFATDILPILQDGTSCGTGVSCHGTPPVFLDPAMTKTLTFTSTTESVKATLLGPSVNAPSMKYVVPKNVGSSFLAYKISGAEALSCVQSNCTAGTTTGKTTPCGDGMPPPGYTPTASDRTKILDWIAQGAAD